MDPFAHTFAGAALAATGLRKTTALATTALLIGVNLPDIDILASYTGEYMALAHRRGWSHGLLAWVVLPILLAGLLLAWDRLVRRKLKPEAKPAKALVLLMLCTVAVLSHPALDWLNNYGIRLLMPFNGRWFYGDALFIIDPWVWLVLGGSSFLLGSRHWSNLLGWLLFWAAATWLISSNGIVPDMALLLWVTGLGILMVLRFLFPSNFGERTAQFALTLTVFYMGCNAIASKQARLEVGNSMASQGFGRVEDVMVGPVPANPFRGMVVVETEGSYLLGSWNWFNSPRLQLNEVSLPSNMANPLVRAATEHRLARRFLIWSRFPYAEIESQPQGYLVKFSDARYASLGGGIGGPAVVLDEEANILADANIGAAMLAQEGQSGNTNGADL